MAFNLRGRMHALLDDIASGRISLTVDYLRLADEPTPASCRGDADCRCIDAVSPDRRQSGYCRQLNDITP